MAGQEQPKRRLEPDELPGKPGARVRELVRQAAALREARRPWSEVAEKVGRSPHTVKSWPEDYRERWELYTVQAAAARADEFEALVQRLVATVLEGGVEAVLGLRLLGRGKLPSERPTEDAKPGKDDVPPVPAQVREAALHSLLTAALKLVGDEKRYDRELEELRRNHVPKTELERFAERAVELVLTYVPEEARAACRRDLLGLPWLGG